MEKSGNSTEYNPVKRRRHSYVTERAQRTDYLTKLLKEKSSRNSYRTSVNARSFRRANIAEIASVPDNTTASDYRLYKAAAHHDLASKSTEKPPD